MGPVKPQGVERIGVQVAYVTGLSNFEPLPGGDMRLTFFVEREGLQIDSQELIMPTSSVPPFLTAIAMSLGYMLVAFNPGRKH